MEEIWKDIPGYESLYQVSNFGRVKSLNYRGTRKEKILKTTENGKGYLRVGIDENGKMKTLRVHRLVLLAFIGKSDLQVNHLDGVKTNNRLENLEYCTQSENMKHAFKIGLTNHKGEHHPYHKLTEKDVLEIRKLYKSGDYVQRELSIIYNVSRTTIEAIVTRKNWAHI